MVVIILIIIIIFLIRKRLHSRKQKNTYYTVHDKSGVVLDKVFSRASATPDVAREIVDSNQL